MELLFHNIYALNLGTFILIILFASLAVMFFRQAFKNKKFYNYVIVVGFLLYSFLMVYVTLGNRSSEIREINLLPFYSYYRGVTEQPEMFREILMNTGLFFPFGLLFCCIETKRVKRKSWCILIALCISIIVEVIQYIFSLGYSEIDDVIHNTLGATLGMGFYYLFIKIGNTLKPENNTEL